MAEKFLNGIDLANQRGINFSDPSSGTDAATKQYVDNVARGLDWKNSVRAATTAAGTLASSFANGSSIDGVSLVTGDRILIKNQSSGAENGIYTVNASGAPTRAVDADASAEVTSGLSVSVEEGTVNGDQVWMLTTNGAIVLGTTALTFSQLGGGGITYTADSTGGLQLTSSAFAVKLPASSGLIKDSTGLYLDTSIAVRKFAANIGDGTTTAIAVTHGLGTRDITYTIYNATTYEVVRTDAVITSASVLTLTFAVAPTTNQYRVVVQA